MMVNSSSPTLGLYPFNLEDLFPVNSSKYPKTMCLPMNQSVWPKGGINFLNGQAWVRCLELGLNVAFQRKIQSSFQKWEKWMLCNSCLEKRPFGMKAEIKGYQFTMSERSGSQETWTSTSVLLKLRSLVAILLSSSSHRLLVVVGRPIRKD